ncbi:hypothetical protein PR202_gb00970 [Eleusine coracana subsp. coracana]|uniref:Uncharacterized protein n=1 Tax=Eleusine coracana subsp. coracana TaxID=191504 RepID=A0AAV5DVG8_ELECO|nr:hypothetical protein PR202_gb00970 [Eleusine coracana subsp. coracana]
MMMHRQDRPVAVLRQQVYERRIILYVQCNAWPVASSWVVLADPLAAVSLLAGDLDATARALRRDDDARVAALWRGILYGLCRRALVDLCRMNDVAP